MASRYFRLFLIIAGPVALNTCGEPTGPDLARLEVAGPGVLRIGYRVRYNVRVYDSRDTLVAGIQARWSSSDESVATVTDDGFVTGRDTGATVIEAVAAGVRGSRAVSVTLVPVNFLQLALAADSLYEADTLRFTVTARDSTFQPLSLAGRPIDWLISDTAKVAVDAAGLVRGRRAGGVAVTARVGSASAGVFVTVLARAVSLTLPESVVIARDERAWMVADLRSAAGTHLAGRPVVWASLDPAVAMVDPTGIVTPVAAGRGRVSASCCQGLADTMAVVVVDAGPNQVALLTAQPALRPGETASVAVAVRDSAGRTLTVPVTWQTADSSIATVVPDSAGAAAAMVTALREGTTAVVASAGGRQRSIGVFVSGAQSRPAALVMEPDTMHMYAGGPSKSIFRLVRDDAGDYQAVPPGMTLRVGDPAIATVGAADLVDPRTPGQTTIIGSVAIGGRALTDTVVVVVEPAPPAMYLRWSSNQFSVARFTDVTYRFVVTDPPGDVIDNLGSAIVTSSDSAAIEVLTPVAPESVGVRRIDLRIKRRGGSMITVTIDTFVTRVWMTAVDDPVEAVDVSAPATMALGDVAAAALSTRNALGVQQTYVVRWFTSDTTVAAVSNAGMIAARAAGAVWLHAVVEGRRDSARIVVSQPGGPVLGAFSELRAGTEVLLPGTGFGAAPGDNAVSIGGRFATVTGVGANGITVRVPPSDVWPCGPGMAVGVTVATAGGTTAATATLLPGERIELGPGVVAERSGNRCLDLADGGWYQIAVASGSATADAASVIAIHGFARDADYRSPGTVPGGTQLSDAIAGALARRRAALPLQMRALEAGRRLAQVAGPVAQLLRARPRAPQASVGDSVGSRVRFRVPRLDLPDFCSAYTSVIGNRVYQGPHLEIFAAGPAPSAAALTALGTEFEAVMYPILLQHFGDPLALDSLLDRSGRLTVLITSAVNAYAAGFVTACDFYPESVAPSSNTGETIYLFAPETPPPGFPGGSDGYWLWQARAVLMHEAKHVTAIAERLGLVRDLEVSWLEEATAVVAEELWSRTIYQTSWRGNADYGSTIYCDVRPGASSCAGRPLAMANALSLLHDFGGWPRANAYEQRSPLGPTAPGDATFYGSGWAMVRFAMDLGSSEPAFLRSLTTAPETGTLNLSLRAQAQFGSIAGDWLTALTTDGLFEVAPLMSNRFLGWDLPDIFAGFARDFPGSFVAQPFAARTLDAADSVIVAARGGSGTVVRVRAASGQRVLAITGDGGLPLPGSVVIRISRIE